MAKTLTAIRLAPDLLDALRRLKARDGVPMSVQVDFALRAWLSRKGVLPRVAASKKGGR